MLRREEQRLPAWAWGPTSPGRMLPATVQAVVAARIDQLTPAGPRARAAGQRVPARPLRPGRAGPPRGAPQGAAGRGGGRGAPRARRGTARRRGASAATSCATSRTTRSPSASASGCTCGSRTSCRSRERRTGTRARSRSTWSRRRCAALDLNPRDRTLAERAAEALAHAGDLARPPDRVALGRRPLRARARALRPAGRRGGSARPGSCRCWARARYWLGEFDAAEDAFHQALAIAGETSDRVLRARVAVPRRHHAHDPRRRPARPARLFDRAARRRPASRRSVHARAHPADGGVGPVLAERPGPRRGDVPRGAGGGALGTASRRLGRVARAGGSRQRDLARGRRGRGAGGRPGGARGRARRAARRSRRRSRTRRSRRRCGG